MYWRNSHGSRRPSGLLTMTITDPKHRKRLKELCRFREMLCASFTSVAATPRRRQAPMIPGRGVSAAGKEP